MVSTFSCFECYNCTQKEGYIEKAETILLLGPWVSMKEGWASGLEKFMGDKRKLWERETCNSDITEISLEVQQNSLMTNFTVT